MEIIKTTIGQAGQCSFCPLQDRSTVVVEIIANGLGVRVCASCADKIGRSHVETKG